MVLSCSNQVYCVLIPMETALSVIWKLNTCTKFYIYNVIETRRTACNRHRRTSRWGAHIFIFFNFENWFLNGIIEDSSEQLEAGSGLSSFWDVGSCMDLRHRQIIVLAFHSRQNYSMGFEETLEVYYTLRSFLAASHAV